MEWYTWLILIFIVIAIIGHFSGNPEKKCAWCNSKKIKFKSGKKGKFYWEYRNKDGSQDKRVKDNVQKAGFLSTYECEECNALTDFKHFVDKDPGQNVDIWRRTLNKTGNGEREGSDWESSSATTVETKGPNRKGDEN